MLILGIAFTVIVCGLAQLLVNPPAGYVAGAKPARPVLPRNPPPPAPPRAKSCATPAF